MIEYNQHVLYSEGRQDGGRFSKDKAQREETKTIAGPRIDMLGLYLNKRCTPWVCNVIAPAYSTILRHGISFDHQCLQP